MSSLGWKALIAVVLYLGVFFWGFTTAERVVTAQWQSKWDGAVLKATEQRNAELNRQLQASSKIATDAQDRQQSYEAQILALEKELDNYVSSEEWLSPEIAAPTATSPASSAGKQTRPARKPVRRPGGGSLTASDVERLRKLAKPLAPVKPSAPQPSGSPLGLW